MLQLIGPTNCHLTEGPHRLPGSVCVYILPWCVPRVHTFSSFARFVSIQCFCWRQWKKRCKYFLHVSRNSFIFACVSIWDFWTYFLALRFTFLLYQTSLFGGLLNLPFIVPLMGRISVDPKKRATFQISLMRRKESCICLFASIFTDSNEMWMTWVEFLKCADCVDRWLTEKWPDFSCLLIQLSPLIRSAGMSFYFLLHLQMSHA